MIEKHPLSDTKFVFAILRFFLTNENATKEWINHPALMRAFYIDAISGILCACFVTIVPSVLDGAGSEVHALIIRLVRATSVSVFLASTIYLSLCYYLFMLRYGKGIFFSNIITLWFSCAYLFGYLYYSLYTLNPALFEYKDAPVIPTALIQYQGWSGFKAALDFLLYSILNSVLANYWRIHPKSYLISCLSAVQVLQGLFFILFIFGTASRKLKK
jgi:hypothetical protein